MSNAMPSASSAQQAPEPSPAPHRSHAENTLEYAVMDVFAERALEGNPLAIMTDARGLSDAQMQQIARETNLAETSFILPREARIESAEGVRVRIFTTREELPFAGHPTLGTAAWLHLFHPTLAGQQRIRLALNVGTIPVEFATCTAQPGVFGTMRQKDPTFGQTFAAEAIAAATGLQPEDLDEELPAQVVSTGTAFCIVALRSVAITARLRVDQQRAQQFLDQAGARFFYFVTRTPENRSGADFRARMPFYGGEDPTTGSAAGCAISWLVEHGRVPAGQDVVLEQGIEIERPSRLHLRASICDGRVTDVFVGGRTMRVARGELFLP